jgi:hypothetical protein
MKSVYVKFNNKDDIGNFVNIVSSYDGDFDLVKGRKMIDAKSFLGILCFELTAPLRLDIYNENDRILEDLSSYIVND